MILKVWHYIGYVFGMFNLWWNLKTDEYSKIQTFGIPSGEGEDIKNETIYVIRLGMFESVIAMGQQEHKWKSKRRKFGVENQVQCEGEKNEISAFCL